MDHQDDSCLVHGPLLAAILISPSCPCNGFALITNPAPLSSFGSNSLDWKITTQQTDLPLAAMNGNTMNQPLLVDAIRCARVPFFVMYFVPAMWPSISMEALHPVSSPKMQ